MSTYKSLIPSKRKSDENEDVLPIKKVVDNRNPLGILVANNIPYQNTQGRGSGKEETYWKVQWRKPQTKKHKTWDDDGVLVVSGSKLVLKGLDDKIISTGTISARTGVIEEGASFQVGGKELEIDSAIPKEEYLSGRCFDAGVAIAYIPEPPRPAPKPQPVLPFANRSVAGPSKPPALGIGSRPISLPRNPTVPSRVPEPKPMPHPVDADYRAKRYYTVNWRKPQTKKHKTWDGDAYLVVTGDRCVMQEANGRCMGIATWHDSWLGGAVAHIGNKEVEIDGLITEEEFRQQCSGEPPSEVPVLPPSRTASAPFKPALPHGAVERSESTTTGGPLHDPNAKGAIVMPRPTPAQQAKAGKSGKTIQDVVVDPYLADRLRPHQKEGLIFLYEAVMGLRRHEGNGAILADEMGLGKTLQTIALLFTLLRQTPYQPHDLKNKGEIGKAMIVCPVSLVTNWRNEIWKWLGRDRLSVFVAQDTDKIKQFNHSRSHEVLIIGYEKLRTVMPPIDLIICDEGHRLKSANNKTSKMFDALKTRRRIILSGTPIQNDLSEFWAMSDFCNPGLLGDYNDFKRIYENPILRSRMPNCTDKNKELGIARAEQLTNASKSFVLRRTADILVSYLPPKYEYVVFIRPVKSQLDLMRCGLSEQRVGRLIRSGMSQALEMMNILGKICTSPVLLKSSAKPPSQWTPEYKDLVAMLPAHMEESDSSFSGKLVALVSFLKTIRKNTDEKVVIVSQYTRTLDLIEAICNKYRWSRTRLDGSTPQADRDQRVSDFNRSPQELCFIFLLSLKAGGVGLNLVGGSRLILLDSSWNPAHDLQAMARIHRDGQKKPVHIYRFLTAGTFDEKVFMRQVIKTGLSNALMAGDGTGKSKEDSFSPEELRDLFRFHPHTPSHTHDLLDCGCPASNPEDAEESDPAEADGGADEANSGSDSESEAPHRGWMLASQVQEKDIAAKAKKKKKELAILDEWTHINCMGSAGRQSIKDVLLRDMVNKAYTKNIDSNEEAEGNDSSRVAKLIKDFENPADDSDNESGTVANMDEVPGGAITFLFTKCTM